MVWTNLTTWKNKMILHRQGNPLEVRPSVIFLLVLALVVMYTVPACMYDPGGAGSFKSVFDHYRDQDNVEAISFPPGLVSIFLDDSDPEQAELKKLMKELSSFRMLSLNDGSSGPETGDLTQVEEMKETILEFTSENEFQDLIRIQSDGQDIFIRIREKDGLVKEAILMMECRRQFFCY